MPSPFRLGVEFLEGRDVPASFSSTFTDPLIGSGVVWGQFSTPSGVDPTQASQSLVISDLTVSAQTGIATFNGAYDILGTPTANYAYGQLVGVTGDAWRTGGIFIQSLQFSFVNSSVYVTGAGSWANVVYDGAETKDTFTFSDGTTGALSYTPPWDQVDPTQASQSLALSTFNLNIAGRNFAYGSASYTTAPTALFEYGEFRGFSFALDTSAVAGFAYTSITGTFDITGNNVIQAIQAGTGQQFLAAPVPQQAVELDFTTAARDRDNTIKLTFSDGRDKEMVTVSVDVSRTDSAADVAYKVAAAINGTGKFTAVRDGTNVKITTLPDGRGWAGLNYSTYVNNLWTPTLTGATLTGRKVVVITGGQVQQ